MNDWMLNIDIPKPAAQLHYKDKILVVGSCFSENIGLLMTDYKFQTLLNPNGILFDPISISRSLNNYLNNNVAVEEDLFQNNSLWHSWHHHSSFSNPDKQQVLNEINNSTHQAHSFLKEAKWLIITLGSAWHYSLKSNNQSVANCHKVPNDQFTRQLVQIEDQLANYRSLISELKNYNKELKIIFTVSPVRHIKDGIIENNRSKARLLEIVHTLAEEHAHISYFPSYELIIDVLRDYRFYKEDMVHPSDQAIRYVFDRFIDIYLDYESKGIFKEIDNWLKQSNHKPLFPGSQAHNEFILSHKKLTGKLREKYPYLSFD